MNLPNWTLTPAAICAAVLLAACSQVAETDSADPASPQEAGKAFLAENGKREGVTTTASGLQYEVLASGGGPSPKPIDTVTAHYHGTLIDGTVFDSSLERDAPFETKVNGVIQGWQEALQLMGVGDKWKVYIPSELAYGEREVGIIGPHETLIFEMELLSIEAQEGEAAPAEGEAQAPEETQATEIQTQEDAQASDEAQVEAAGEAQEGT